MYTELIIGEKIFKLKLTTRASVMLEKSLGYNPIGMLMDIDNGKMPKMTDCLIILQAMLQTYHHGYGLDKVYDLFDEFIADGKSLFDLIPIFVEVFQQSGYISTNVAKDEIDEKN